MSDLADISRPAPSVRQPLAAGPRFGALRGGITGAPEPVER